MAEIRNGSGGEGGPGINVNMSSSGTEETVRKVNKVKSSVEDLGKTSKKAFGEDLTKAVKNSTSAFEKLKKQTSSFAKYAGGLFGVRFLSKVNETDKSLDKMAKSTKKAGKEVDKTFGKENVDNIKKTDAAIKGAGKSTDSLYVKLKRAAGAYWGRAAFGAGAVYHTASNASTAAFVGETFFEGGAQGGAGPAGGHGQPPPNTFGTRAGGPSSILNPYGGFGGGDGTPFGTATSIVGGHYTGGDNNSILSFLQTANSLSSQLNDTLSSLGAGLSLGYLTYEAAKFEQVLANTAAVAGATGSALEALRAKSLELGASTKFTAAEVAAGMEFLSRAGFTVGETLEAIEPALQLAAVGNLEIAQAADIATNVLAGFRSQVSELPRYFDVLAKASVTSNTTIYELGSAMRWAAPAAKAFGVSVEETTAALATLAEAGLKGGSAGAGFRRGLIALTRPTKQTRKMFKDHGLDVEDVDLSDFTGTMEEMSAAGIDAADVYKTLSFRAAASMAVFLSGTDTLRDFTVSLNDSKGALKKVADSINDNLLFYFKELVATTQEFWTNVIGGRTVIPIIQNLTDKIKSLSGWVEEAKTVFNVAFGVVIIWSIIKATTKMGLLIGITAASYGVFANFRAILIAVGTAFDVVAKTQITAFIKQLTFADVRAATMRWGREGLAAFGRLLKVTSLEIRKGMMPGLIALKNNFIGLGKGIVSAGVAMGGFLIRLGTLAALLSANVIGYIATIWAAGHLYDAFTSEREDGLEVSKTALEYEVLETKAIYNKLKVLNEELELTKELNKERKKKEDSNYSREFKELIPWDDLRVPHAKRPKGWQYLGYSDLTPAEKKIVEPHLAGHNRTEGFLDQQVEEFGKHNFGVSDKELRRIIADAVPGRRDLGSGEFKSGPFSGLSGGGIGTIKSEPVDKLEELARKRFQELKKEHIALEQKKDDIRSEFNGDSILSIFGGEKPNEKQFDARIKAIDIAQEGVDDEIEHLKGLLEKVNENSLMLNKVKGEMKKSRDVFINTLINAKPTKPTDTLNAFFGDYSKTLGKENEVPTPFLDWIDEAFKDEKLKRKFTKNDEAVSAALTAAETELDLGSLGELTQELKNLKENGVSELEFVLDGAADKEEFKWKRIVDLVEAIGLIKQKALNRLRAAGQKLHQADLSKRDGVLETTDEIFPFSVFDLGTEIAGFTDDTYGNTFGAEQHIDLANTIGLPGAVNANREEGLFASKNRRARNISTTKDLRKQNKQAGFTLENLKSGVEDPGGLARHLVEIKKLESQIAAEKKRAVGFEGDSKEISGQIVDELNEQLTLKEAIYKKTKAINKETAINRIESRVADDLRKAKIELQGGNVAAELMRDTLTELGVKAGRLEKILSKLSEIDFLKGTKKLIDDTKKLIDDLKNIDNRISDIKRGDEPLSREDSVIRDLADTTRKPEKEIKEILGMSAKEIELSGTKENANYYSAIQQQFSKLTEEQAAISEQSIIAAEEQLKIDRKRAKLSDEELYVAEQWAGRSDRNDLDTDQKARLEAVWRGIHRDENPPPPSTQDRFKQYIKDWDTELTGSFENLGLDALRTGVEGISEAFKDMAFHGVSLGKTLKSVFFNIAGSIAEALAEAIIFDAVISPLTGYNRQTKSFGGGLAGGVVGGIGSEFGSGIGSWFKDIFAFADGGVIDGAMPFKYGKNIGVMGEAGPEAILPLKRGPDGSLGVKAGGMSGGMGDGVNTTINIQVDSGAGGSDEDKQKLAAAMGEQVRQVVDERIGAQLLKQNRRGGSLNNTVA